MEKKQKEQLKKILIYSGIGLLFTLSMWFIFRPSEKSGTEEEKGLNKELPQATIEQLPENKLKVYEMGEHLEQEEISRSEMGQLSDYFERQGEETNDSEHTSSVSKVASSMERYEENSRLLSSFYDYDPREEEREAMQAEIEELRARLEAQESEQDEEEKQLALMEKSYQMAAKYMTQATPPSNSPSATNAKEETSVTSASTTLPEVELMPERKHLVSSLEQPMTDSAFIAEYAGKERNLGFHSLSAQRPAPLRNTLRCVVDRTTTLQEGDFIVLRLPEGARLHNLFLCLATAVSWLKLKLRAIVCDCLFKALRSEVTFPPSSSQPTTQTDKRASTSPALRIYLPSKKWGRTSEALPVPPSPLLLLLRIKLSPMLHAV